MRYLGYLHTFVVEHVVLKLNESSKKVFNLQIFHIFRKLKICFPLQ